MESHTFTICRDGYCNSVYFHMVLLTLRKLLLSSQHWRPGGQATSSQCPGPLFPSASYMPNMESTMIFSHILKFHTVLIQVLPGMAGLSSHSCITTAYHCSNIPQPQVCSARISPYAGGTASCLNL